MSTPLTANFRLPTSLKINQKFVSVKREVYDAALLTSQEEAMRLVAIELHNDYLCMTIEEEGDNTLRVRTLNKDAILNLTGTPIPFELWSATTANWSILNFCAASGVDMTEVQSKLTGFWAPCAPFLTYTSDNLAPGTESEFPLLVHLFENKDTVVTEASSLLRVQHYEQLDNRILEFEAVKQQMLSDNEANPDGIPFLPFHSSNEGYFLLTLAVYNRDVISCDADHYLVEVAYVNLYLKLQAPIEAAD